jgi:hypothetical protein
MNVLDVSAAAARRFLVRRHLLAPPRWLPAGLDGVRAVFARLGSIQFDPLAVAGRNHDLVLQARVRDYDPAWTNELLYERRELFETYNKMLSLLPTAELPWYRQAWERFAAAHQDAAFARHGETVTHVLDEIRDRGPLSSLDFERRGTVDWYWGPTSEVRAVLEALSEAGVISLARREGNRRYFDLTERLYPAALLAVRPDERDQGRHKLRSRYRAHGLLGEGGQAELWYGTGKARPAPGDPPGTLTRQGLRDELVSSGDLVPVAVEGVRGTRFVVAEELELLHEVMAETALGGPARDGGVTFLAPLDPFVWDRDLLRSLFGFDYVWEVYTPRARRRWGYYVLPILWADRLVGRIEPRIVRAERTVRILGLWWEHGFRPRQEDGFVDAMREALAAYLRFAGAERLDWGDRSAERRLFGVRPRGVEEDRPGPRSAGALAVRPGTPGRRAR